MDTSYYAKDKNNIPILSQDQIDNIAEMELKKFQKQALTRPTAIDIDGFLEMHLHVTPDYQYLSHNMVYLGMSVFYDTNAIPIYDEITGRAEYLSVKANTVIFDRRLVENKSQEHRYRFTGGHEAGHFVLHSSYYRRNRSLGKSDNLFAKCHTSSLCGMKKGNLVTDNDWLEWQANQFSSSLLMPKSAVLLLHRSIGDKKLLLQEMPKIFNVSNEAARNRLKNLKIIL